MSITWNLFRIGVPLTLISLACIPLAAQNPATVIGSNGFWSSPATWNTGVIPNNSSSTNFFVTITNSDPNQFPGGVIVDDNLTISGLNITTDGGLSFFSGYTLNVINSSPVINSGRIDITDQQSGSLVVSGDLSNLSTGVLNIHEGGGPLQVGGTLNNYGSLSVTGHGQGAYLYAGALHNHASGTVFGDVSDAEIHVGSSINDGSIEMRNGSVLDVAGDLQNRGFMQITDGSVVAGFPRVGGNLTNEGSLRIGSWTNMTVGGELRNSGDLTVEFSSTVLVTGAAQNTGTLILDNASPDPNFPAGLTADSFSNTGSVLIGRDTTLSATNNYSQTQGSTVVDGVLESTIGALQFSGGQLSGNGTLNGDVFMNGQMSAGQFGSAGTLTINGDFTQAGGGATTADLGGAFAGSEYDQIIINGNAALGGTLNIVLINGFLPQLGDSFVVLIFNSLTGTFQTINGINFAPGLMFAPIYDGTSLTLTVSQTPEPTTLILFGSGIAALAWRIRRKRTA